MRLRRVLEGVAALHVAAALLGVHPALRGEGPLAETGKDIAGATARSLRGMATLGAVDAGAPVALAVLVVSVLCIATLGIVRLAGDGVASPPREESTHLRIPLAALLGHYAGILASVMGGGGAAWFMGTGAVAAGVLLLPPRRPDAAPDGVPPHRRDHPGRKPGWLLLLLLLLACVLFLVAGAADGLLQAVVVRRAFPEAWFVLAVESGGGFALPALGVVLALAAAAFGMERAAERRDGEGVADLLGDAAAWALLLGPSNPVRGFALALSLRCLARAGIPVAARAAVAPGLSMGMAAMVFVL